MQGHFSFDLFNYYLSLRKGQNILKLLHSFFMKLQTAEMKPVIRDAVKIIFIAIPLFFSFYSVEAQLKKALIVGIGNYPTENGWNQIHGDNDVPLIKSSLLENGFQEENIIYLVDQQATKKNIELQLDKLITAAQPNDIFYIHFSTHGQQVLDVNGDEADSLDEAIIPYDAMKDPVEGGYNGENHFLDDELNVYLSQIREKIGNGGSILVMLDACHSGDATRGRETDNDSVFVRGTSDIFHMDPERAHQTSPAQPLEWVAISAAKSYQNNYEYKLGDDYFGSLSYAVSLAFKGLPPNINFIELFELINRARTEMKIGSYPQNPTIDGDNIYQKQKAF